MQKCIKIYYSIVVWSSTCFGQHAAHHQELKTALAASGFAYMRGCWMLRLLDADSIQQPQRPTTSNVCKTRDCWCSFELLVMGGLSPETCWALYKYGIINFDTLLHLVGYFCMNLKIQCIWNSDLYHYVLFRYWNNSEPVCFKDGAVLHGSSTIQYGNASLPCGSHCYGWLIQGTETYYNSQCHCSKLK